MSEVSLSLSLLYEDALVGALQVSSHEGEPRFSFTYSGAWRSTPHAFSLSLALPLREAPYGHQASRAYFENLLPEGEVITQLKRYAHQRGELTQGQLSDEAFTLIQRRTAHLSARMGWG